MLLDRNWLTQPRIDFELKTYILLGYLQRVARKFAENRIYPYHKHLKQHHENLLLLRNSQQNMLDEFPAKLTGFDWKKMEWVRHADWEHPPHLSAIQSVIDFAIPRMEKMLREGEERRESLLKDLDLMPVGLLPLYRKEGYLFLRSGTQVKVYNYHLSVLRNSREEWQYQSIRTHYVTSYPGNFYYTFENIKSDLIRKDQSMPNPATYAVCSSLKLSHKETLLPLAKQALWCANSW